LGVFFVFFWSPVTGSKEQRSAKFSQPSDWRVCSVPLISALQMTFSAFKGSFGAFLAFAVHESCSFSSRQSKS
jgi:hypothetical protein